MKRRGLAAVIQEDNKYGEFEYLDPEIVGDLNDENLQEELRILEDEFNFRKEGEPTVKIMDVLSFLTDRKEDYKQIRDVVPIHEWTRSTYYLGEEANTLYPFWEDVLVEFCEEGSGYNELILGGSIRSGKSNTALLLGIRKFYELSCFHPIPRVFGLSESSLLLFMYLSLSLLQANLLGMGRIRRMLDQIPYFREFFPRDKKSETLIRFKDPCLTMIGGSELGHFKGSDLFYLIFDEANFARGAVDLKFQNAVDIYREATTRRKSTFIVDGVEHGCGVIISSADTQTSFVEKHIEDARHNSNTLIVNAVAYEVQPERYANVGTFPIFAGDDLIDPFVINDDPISMKNLCAVYKIKYEPTFDIENMPLEIKDKFLYVPNSFIEQFRLDIYGALKEICGVSAGQTNRFFMNRVKYAQAFPKTDAHPFTKEAIVLSYADMIQLKEYWIKEAEDMNSHYEYFGGIDQSLTNDATGLALCHFDPTKDDLLVEFDFMLLILPPQKPAKISPEKIVMFFVWLNQKMNVKSLSIRMDTYAAEQSQQTLIMEGIDVESKSVDKNWDAYRAFAGAILDDRVKGYHFPAFKSELFALVQDNDRRKIDHPASGTKDVSDANCQAFNAALSAWLELKGGMRYFSDFGSHNLEIYRVNERLNNLYCGIYFGPQAFYCLWLTLEHKGTNEAFVRVVSEYVDYASTTFKRVTWLKRQENFLGFNCIYAGDPKARIKSDITGTSPFREYREKGIQVRCRKKMDRYNFEIINGLLRSKQDPKLLLNEPEVPMLVRSFRKLKYKLRHGVKTGEMQKVGDEFPLIALRVVLEEALSKASATGY